MIPRELLADLHRLVDHLADNADTIGELAAELERVSSDTADAIAGLRFSHVREREVRHRCDAELRDDLHELARKVQSLERTLNARTERAA